MYNGGKYRKRFSPFEADEEGMIWEREGPNETNKYLTVFPNPEREWISLTLPDNVSSGTIEIAFYNIFGQEIMKTRVLPQNRMVSFNVSNLSSGFYYAACKDEKRKIFNGKFIVAR